MRPINLLPPEAFERAKTRRRVVQILLVGLAYVALLVLLTFVWSGRVDRAEQDVAAQERVNSELQGQLNALSDAGDLSDRYLSNAALIAGSLITDVSWGRILNDLARMIPERVWLESFSGTVAADAAAASVGTIQMNVIGFDYPDVSAWLRSLDSDRFPSVSGTWVTSASSATIGEADIVTFASSTALTFDSLSDRAGERVPEVVP